MASNDCAHQCHGEDGYTAGSFIHYITFHLLLEKNVTNHCCKLLHTELLMLVGEYYIFNIGFHFYLYFCNKMER